MKVAYLGNHGPSFSTESHYAASWEAEGHEVVRIQEGDTPATQVPDLASGADLFLWTQTYGLAEQGGTRAERCAMLDKVKAQGIPTAGVHLDRWWGLDREDQVYREPFFDVDVLFTADGDNDDRWQDADVNHVWLKPAVFHAEVGRGTPRDEYRSRVAFVGNWRGRYHSEWPFRRELVHHLRTVWRDEVRLWPKPGHPAVRGQDLNDLYASVDVVVGDSCFADRSVRYWSDRAYETVGRGGLLLFSGIEGLAADLEDRRHIVYYQPGNLDHLDALIEHYLNAPDEREAIVQAGVQRVRECCTYRHRVREIIGHLEDGGWL